jgi:hypothetical protein
MGDSGSGEEIPTTYEVGIPIYCRKCAAEIVNQDITPDEYSEIKVGYTDLGLQIWCKRHACNVIHIYFGGQKLLANTGWL